MSRLALFCYVYVITEASGTYVETELMHFQVICQDFSSVRNVCKLRTSEEMCVNRTAPPGL